MSLRLIKLLASLILLSMSSTLHAAPHDPKLTWQTLEIPHFLIHFHQGEQEIAQALAAIAEQQHNRLSQQLNWRPQQKTHIVLTDRYDYSNGWATALPQNHITLIIRPPSQAIGIEDYDHWLELVFIHEYIHILHMDMAHGAPAALRNIFGRFPLLFPHIFQPSWIIEGLATQYETDIKRGIGRGQGALFRGMMAIEWQQGVKPPSQINGVTTEWPAGQIPYLYGVYFQQFLSAEYGEEKKQAWLELYSRQIIPFLLNTQLKRIFGKNLETLWGEFQAYLEQHFQADFQQYQPQPTTPISEQGHYSGYAQVMENGDLYYITDSLYDESQLKLLKAGSDQAKSISDIYGRQFDVHPQYGILMIQPETSANSNIFNEIYLLSPDEKTPQRLTHQGRYQFAIWDQQQILAIHYQLGRFALHRLSITGELLEVIWQGNQQTVLSSVQISPNGKHLVGALWQQPQGWDLALFDVKQREWHPLTKNDGIEMQPRFNRDGTSLIFSADYSGFFEVYQLRLSDRHLTQLTHSWGGALHPILSHDESSLYYNKLTATGWQLHRTSPSATPRPLPTNELQSTHHSPPRDVDQQIKPYQALKYLTPSWWLPFISVTENLIMLGATTSGNDPLYRHQYQINLGFDNINSEPYGNLLYRYDRWRTGLQFTAQRRNSYHSDTTLSDEILSIYSRDDLTLSSETPLLQRNHQWALHTGVVLETQGLSYINPGYNINASDRKNSLGGIALSFNNSRSFPRSISQVDGRSINVVAEKNNLFGGDFQGTVKRLDWHEYLRLGKNSVLALRYRAGWGEQQTPRFSLGGSDSSAITLPGRGLALPPFNHFSFPLRGYPEGLASLRGSHMQLINAELRVPLARLERTAMAPPVGLQQLHGALFYEVGRAWDSGEQRIQKRGIGAELNSELLLGYRLPVTLTLGVAKGIDDQGERQFYLQLTGQF